MKNSRFWEKKSKEHGRVICCPECWLIGQIQKDCKKCGGSGGIYEDGTKCK